MAHCCFPNCVIRNDAQVYYFPKPSENVALFEEWVNIIGGELLDMDYETIYENHFICGKHFQYLALKKYQIKPGLVAGKKRKSKKKVKTTPDPIPNLEAEEIDDPLDIKIELPSESDDMDGSETHDDNSDSENLPLITHVKSEALDLSSDGYEMWNEELHDDNLESEQTARENEINDTQINKQLDISEPAQSTARTIKIENDCESEMPGVLNENTEIESNIVNSSGMEQVNVMTKIYNLPDDIGFVLPKEEQNDIDIPLLNSKLEPAKVIKKNSVPINVSKHNDENNTSKYGVKNVLRERTDRPSFSYKSTPMSITKVTSDVGPRPPSKIQTFSLPNLSKGILSSDGVKSILDKLLRNLAIQETTKEAVELAYLANLVYLEHERMIDIIRSYQVKNNLFQTKIQSLQKQLNVTKYKCNSVQNNLDNDVQISHNTAYDVLTKNMPIGLKDLIKMQSRLSNTSHTKDKKMFTTKDKAFALEIYKRSKRTYNYLRKILILPSLMAINTFKKQLCSNTVAYSDSSNGEENTGGLRNYTEISKSKVIVKRNFKNEKRNTAFKRSADDNNVECNVATTNNFLVRKGVTNDKNVLCPTEQKHQFEKKCLSNNIDFEDELDREKWIIKKVETKGIISNEASVSSVNNSKVIFKRSNQKKMLKYPEPMKTNTANIRNSEQSNTKSNIRIELIKKNESNSGTTLKEINTQSTILNKIKEKNALETLKINDHLPENKTDYDSESTLSANEVLTKYSESSEQPKIRLKVDLNNKPTDYEQQISKVIKINEKDIEHQNADDIEHTNERQLSSDNVRSRKWRKKAKYMVKAEITTDSDDECLSSYARRQSSRLASKRRCLPEVEEKT